MMQLVKLNNLKMRLLRSFVLILFRETNELAYIQYHYFTTLIVDGEHLRSTHLLKFKQIQFIKGTPSMHMKGLLLVKYAHRFHLWTMVHLGFLIMKFFDSTEEQTTCVSAADGPSSPKLLGLGQNIWRDNHKSPLIECSLCSPQHLFH